MKTYNQKEIIRITTLFKMNFQARHTNNIQWQKIYRHYAKQALTTLRHLTNRPRKGFPSINWSNYKR